MQTSRLNVPKAGVANGHAAGGTLLQRVEMLEDAMETLLSAQAVALDMPPPAASVRQAGQPLQPPKAAPKHDEGCCCVQ